MSTKPFGKEEYFDVKSQAELLQACSLAEKSIQQNNLKLDKDIVDYLYRIKLSLMNYFYLYNRLDLNLKYYSNLKMIDKLPEFGTFTIKKYDLVSLTGFRKPKDTNALRLLKKLNTHNFKIFYFGNEYNPFNNKPFSYYKKELLKILPKVTKEVCFSG